MLRSSTVCWTAWSAPSTARLSFAGNHPYFAANDAGKVAVIACGLVAVRAIPDVTGRQFVTMVIATMLLYRGFTEIKGRVFGIWSRSSTLDRA